jgi:voltage-gated potassium channel
MKTYASFMDSYLPRRFLRGRRAPFLWFLLVLFGLIQLYAWLFHVLMAWEGQDYSWFTGVYWTLTVMSTLGFGDITFESDLGRAFSTVVLLSGLVLLLGILPFLFIRLVYAPWLEQHAKNRHKAIEQVPDAMKGHVLICTNDPIAPGLLRRLRLAGIPAYLIERDPIVAMQMYDRGIPVIRAEIEAAESHIAAGVERARLVLANSVDTVNTNIVITARDISPKTPIAAIVDSEDSVDILELSGATYVLPLKRRLGEHLANRVSAGSVHPNVIGRFHDLLLAEFPVHNTPLEGKTIRETALRQRVGVTIVGVWQRGRLHPARPDLKLSAHCVPVAFGSADHIKALDQNVLEICQANHNPVLVIGGGAVGRAAVVALKRRGIPVHILERDKRLRHELNGLADQLFIGNAADRKVMMAAGVHKAPSILLTTHDDDMNVYLTVYCRKLNPEARILSRVSQEENVPSIQRAGADFVLSYASLGVQTVMSIINNRELILLGEDLDLFYIPLPESMAGKSLAQAEVGKRTGLNVIAVQSNGKLITNIPPHQSIEKGANLVAIGSSEQREAFAQLFE